MKSDGRSIKIDLANLTLEDDEDEILAVSSDADSTKKVYDLCLVGCFFTASVIHFPAMRSTMENLWHPIKGVHISDLGKK
ncbi:hypothetical protein Gohar_000998 [Gossypium harknessii]|uniref:Uncharacterized protein n=1 Tax=Gossypium harknessii TaxID=34285 RepID=A0A7J9I2G6_9ROSI|nr:hypothetical protein [Gossypium harknessii]